MIIGLAQLIFITAASIIIVAHTPYNSL